MRSLLAPALFLAAAVSLLAATDAAWIVVNASGSARVPQQFVWICHTFVC